MTIEHIELFERGDQLIFDCQSEDGEHIVLQRNDYLEFAMLNAEDLENEA